MRIITFFDIGKKKFLVSQKGNNLICFIRENHNNRYNLSKEEKNIFLKTIKSLTPSYNESTIIRKCTFNNEKYELFYDTHKNIYFTNSLNNEVIAHINYNYNHYANIYYDNLNADEYRDKYITRVIEIGKKFINVSVIALLSLNFLTSCNILVKEESGLENLISVVEESEKEDTLYNGSIIIDYHQETQKYDFKEIHDAIFSNPNLTDSEKELLDKLKFIFDNNHKYMDLDMIIERLSSLKIEYSEEKHEDIGGYYIPSENKIIIYQATSLEDCNIFSFLHEVDHIFQRPSNNFLTELSNELFTREVSRYLFDNNLIDGSRFKSEYVGINTFGNGYDKYMPTFYALAEVIDEDTLKKFQFGSDVNSIVKGLTYTGEGILNQDNAKKFVANVNSMRTYNKESDSHILINPLDLYKIEEECYEELNYYYQLKFGKDMKSDLRKVIYYYNSPTPGFFISDKFNPYTDNENNELQFLMLDYIDEETKIKNEKSMFGFIRIIFPRSYYFNMHANPTITFNSPNFATIEITEEIAKDFNNRIKNNSNLKKD